MTKEEKLEEAKRLYKTANADQRYVLESLFPVLRESEDERIRKELIKHLRDGAEGYMPAGNAEDYTRWLSWLEKQEKSKWCDDDEEELEIAIETLHEAGQYSSANWLKTIKQRMEDEQ
jgi:hypothetical protein